MTSLGKRKRSSLESETERVKGEEKSRKVILDHDGGIDDLVALALLSVAPNVDLLGCIVTDADCFAADAAEASAKLLASVRREKEKKKDSSSIIPVSISQAKAVHPFPSEWRRLACNMRHFPSINDFDSEDDWKCHFCDEAMDGREVLAELVMQSSLSSEKKEQKDQKKERGEEEKVSIIVTGPLCNVAYCIQKYGEKFTKHVDSVVVMGGAVNVHGNVHVEGNDMFAPGTDGTQEWNLYWDAPSAQTVVRCPSLSEKVFFSLDATNDVPITSEFVLRFGKQNAASILSQFVGASYAMTTHWMSVYGRTYFAWDVLTVAWWLDHDVVQEVDKTWVDVEARSGNPSEGRTFHKDSSTNNKEGGYVFVAKKPDAKKFYDTVLRICGKY